MPPQDEPMTTAAPPAFPKLPPSARTSRAQTTRMTTCTTVSANRLFLSRLVFARLQSFLPVMEQENKKLEQALAAGDGAKHCIEADESRAEEDEEQEQAEDKPQVIEMVRRVGRRMVCVRALHLKLTGRLCDARQNFALGMMEDQDDDSSDDSDDDDERVDLKASILSAASGVNSTKLAGDTKDAPFSLKLSSESAKPRPMIQELD